MAIGATAVARLARHQMAYLHDTMTMDRLKCKRVECFKTRWKIVVTLSEALTASH